MKLTNLSSTQINQSWWKILVLMVAMIALLMPQIASAETFSVPFVTDFACSVVSFLRGPIAVIIFIIIVIVTLVFGMIAHVRWETIITVSIVFGVILAVGSILGSNSYIAGIAGLDTCFN